MGRRRRVVRPRRSHPAAATAALVFAAVLLAAIQSGCTDNDLKTYLTRTTGFEGNVHVSGTTGADGSRGTEAEPLATIQAGITLAQWYIQQGVATAVSVLVAEGTYEQNDAEGVSVKMVEGVSLYGGYAPDFSERDPAAYVSTIVDLSETGEDNAAVRAEDGVTKVTVIDGFTIVGGACAAGGLSRAMHVDAASPSIWHNIIDAGNAYVALDIYRDSNPNVQHNSIIGGTSPGWKAALSVSDNSVAFISENTIDGGENGTCIGVFFWETRAYFYNNIVHGGDGDDVTAIEATSNSSVNIEGNAIDAGTGGLDGTMGIRIADSSDASIRYNTITSASPGFDVTGIHVSDISEAYIYANEISCGPAAQMNVIQIADSTWTTISKNHLYGQGAVDGAIGIDFSSSSGVIDNNVINPGSPAAGWTRAIFLSDSDLRIWNNTISGGSGSNSRAIIIMDSTPHIDNNIIFTSGGDSQAAIQEYNENSHPATLRNNAFYRRAGMVLYIDCIDFGGDVWQTLDDIATLHSELNASPGVEDASNNVEGDPSFVSLLGTDVDIDTMDDNDWHLSAVTSISTGGGEEFYESDGDCDGMPRTIPWSIGAYEYDGP